MTHKRVPVAAAIRLFIISVVAAFVTLLVTFLLTRNYALTFIAGMVIGIVSFMVQWQAAPEARR